MNMRKLFKYIATLGPLGYAPAPGTLASLVCIPFIYYFIDYSWYPLLAVSIMIFSFWVAWLSLSLFQDADPAPLVIDEVAGMFCAGMGLWWIISYGSLYKLYALMIIFILFRIFDITKCGFKRTEQALTKQYGAPIVVADDIVAALMSTLVFLIGWYVFGM